MENKTTRLVHTPNALIQCLLLSKVGPVLAKTGVAATNTARALLDDNKTFSLFYLLYNLKIFVTVTMISISDTLPLSRVCLKFFKF